MSYENEKIGNSEHYLWLKGIIAVTLILNVADGVFTIYWVSNGKATEANPMMDALLMRSPEMLMLGKLALVSLGCFLLWRLRCRPLAVIGVFIAFGVYYGITIYHLRAMRPYLEPYKDMIISTYAQWFL